jgi:hypothetical protein
MLLGTLYLNYLGGTGKLSGKSIGEVSEQFSTLLTPAGYAFSIWSLIYLLLIIFVGYQWVGYFKKQGKDSLQKAGPWFSLANIANGLWVLAWCYEMPGLSVLIMFFLLFSLLCLVVRLKLETWDAPLRIIVFVWWPICIYTGWIVVAAVTNVAAYLKSLQWQGGFLSAEMWAVIMLAFATALYLFLTYARNMREATLVGVWGFVAIGYKQLESQENVAAIALIAAGILFIYAAYHGLKNRTTSPFVKLKNKAY